MANWTPEGFIGHLFKTIGKHVAPPKGVNSPAMWGSRDWLAMHFPAAAGTMRMELKHFVFRYGSPGHFVDVFRGYYGPVHKAFLALDLTGQAALEADLLATVARFDTGTGGMMRVPSEYAEIVFDKI